MGGTDIEGILEKHIAAIHTQEPDTLPAAKFGLVHADKDAE